MKKITPKEILLGVIVILVVISTSIFLYPAIMAKSLDSIRDNEKSLKTNNPVEFSYAMRTRVGNVLAYGEITANNPQSLPELVKKYSYIEKVTEKYTLHTRLVCSSYDKNDSCISWRTEIYYTWDTYHIDRLISDDFTFLDVDFSSDQLNLPGGISLPLSSETISSDFVNKASEWYLYEDGDMFAGVGDLRYYYEILPQTFNATVFASFFSEHSNYGVVYYETTPETVINNIEYHHNLMNVLYYGMWILLGGSIYIFIAYYYIDIR